MRARHRLAALDVFVLPGDLQVLCEVLEVLSRRSRLMSATRWPVHERMPAERDDPRDPSGSMAAASSSCLLAPMGLARAKTPLGDFPPKLRTALVGVIEAVTLFG